jgi:cold shock CspA family protein
MKRKRHPVTRELSHGVPLSFFMDDKDLTEQRTKRMPKRMVGTVAGVNRDKGFFFICGPDGRDYFAFAKDLPNHQSLNTLITQVTRIRFSAREPEPVKGPAAYALEIVEEQPDDPTAKQLGMEKEKRYDDSRR